MPLEVVEKIMIHTDSGKREIQLCLGDITTLPKSSETDFIMVSSFPDNYNVVPGTLICALWDAFSLSVKQLAKNKAEDLRRHFHCWISHELPKELPYRRLLCFEQSLRESFNQLKRTAIVGEIFRALFTTFGDKQQSIITPLLATGNQNIQKSRMLRAMVTSCAAWMRAGLPLSRLILVIYHPNPKGTVLSKDDADAVAVFKKLKKSLESDMIIDDFKIEYDLYTAYSSYDQEKVDNFLSRLQELFHNSSKEGGSTNLRFLSSVVDKIEEETQMNRDEDDSNTEQLQLVQKSMLQSKRVLIFLSPNYMQCGRGVEEYNLALCLGHRTGRQVLAPVYLQTINDLPTYMALSQWIDCRFRHRDSDGLDKVTNGVNEVHSLISETFSGDSSLTHSNRDNNKNDIVKPAKDGSYDVFISYSHKDTFEANLFLQAIKDADPSARIFFDRDEIKTGHSWQTSLYSALTNSRVVLALMSPSYVTSVVCQEEMSIALSQHLAGKHSTLLLPVAITSKLLPFTGTEEQDTAKVQLAPVFSHLPILLPRFEESPPLTKDIDRDDNLEKSSFLLLRATASFLAKRITGRSLAEMAEDKDIFTTQDVQWDCSSIIETAKVDFFHRNWEMVSNHSKFILKLPTKTQGGYQPSNLLLSLSKQGKLQDWNAQLASENFKKRQIVISYQRDDQLSANFLKSRLLNVNSSCSIILACADEPESMRSMDEGHVIICLLNSTYVTMTTCVHNLLVALSRHRQGEALLCPVLLGNLPSRPTFLQLLPARFAVLEPPFTKLSTSCLPVNYNFNLAKKSSTIKGGKLIRYDSDALSINNQLVLEATAQWVVGRALYGGISTVSTPVVLSLEDLKVSGFCQPKKVTLEWQHLKALPIPRSYVNSVVQAQRTRRSSLISSHCPIKENPESPRNSSGHTVSQHTTSSSPSTMEVQQEASEHADQHHASSPVSSHDYSFQQKASSSKTFTHENEAKKVKLSKPLKHCVLH